MTSIINRIKKFFEEKRRNKFERKEIMRFIQNQIDNPIDYEKLSRARRESYKNTVDIFDDEDED